MDLETCRCGTELIVTHGAAIHCCHCDEPCAMRSTCRFCLQLNRTCTDCGTGHESSQAAIKCEMSHPMVLP